MQHFTISRTKTHQSLQKRVRNTVDLKAIRVGDTVTCTFKVARVSLEIEIDNRIRECSVYAEIITDHVPADVKVGDKFKRKSHYNQLTYRVEAIVNPPTDGPNSTPVCVMPINGAFQGAVKRLTELQSPGYERVD